MSETDRRGFLRGALKAALLGTGGVLLPMEGRRLFSFPNVAALPDIPVIAKGFAPSAECLELRQIKRELTASHLAQEQLGYEESNRRWAALWHRHDAVAQVLYDRPVRTWSQVSEFAEIAWLHAQKEEEEMGDPSWRYSVNTGRLARKTESNSNWRGWSSCSSATASYAALIEGVLTLTGGERYDPRVESFNRTYGSA